MANVAGRGTGRRATTGTSTHTRAGAARNRAPVELALADLVRQNFAAVDLDTALAEDDRLDHDDFPDGDLTPDLGQSDDDEPFAEEPDERPSVFPTRPDIFLWQGSTGVDWEIRPASETLLADADLARLAVRRERLLERYAVGLTTDFLGPSVVGQGLAKADLIDIWVAIPTRNPTDPYDATRWNTQAAIVRRWDIDVSSLSRDRTVLVSLPNGHVVPFQFFTWKTENDALVEAIAKTENVFSGSTKAVAESVTPQPRAQRTARDYVPWVRASLLHQEIVRRSQDQFRSFPAKFEATLDWLRQSLSEAEAERTGKALGTQGRSLPVLQRVLVGGI